MKKRKAYLVLELDADEVFQLPPHLRGLLSRPLIEPVQTREALAGAKPWPGFEETEGQRRARRRQERQERAARASQNQEG